MRGSVLRGLLFGPGHLNSTVMLGAAASAARRPVSLTAVGVVVVVRADARQPQHGVAVFHQLGLIRYRDTNTLFLISSQTVSQDYSMPPSRCSPFPDSFLTV